MRTATPHKSSSSSRVNVVFGAAAQDTTISASPAVQKVAVRGARFDFVKSTSF